MTTAFSSHPIYGLPFPGSVPNELRQEYRTLPRTRQWSLTRRVWQRELLLLAAGQRRLRLPRIPPDARRILWHYTWATIGDAVMDLSQRHLFPPHMEVELCIAPHLAQLFARDRRFAAIHHAPDDCQGRYDFVLLHDLGTRAIKLKLRHHASTPFNTIFGHLNGECFSRIDFVTQRLAQLLDLPTPKAALPSLPLEVCDLAESSHYRVGVTLGARDARRRYPHWPAVLAQVLIQWPEERRPPVFVLMGDGNAGEDLAAFSHEFLDAHCEVAVNRLSLMETTHLIRGCDAFLGADGGLMHLAVTSNRPGLALFTDIRPEWRLHPEARLQGYFQTGPMHAFDPRQIATGFLRALPTVFSEKSKWTSPRKPIAFLDRDLLPHT